MVTEGDSLTRVGAIFPQHEIDGREEIDELLAGLGPEVNHIVAFDHVVGVDPAGRTDWPPPGMSSPYTIEHRFHEPMTLFAYIAGKWDGELATGVLVAPQRQTALIAKQATQLALLTGGRFRLGVGVGWNHVEYQALGADFSRRGEMLDEQIEVLRRLWSTPVVKFTGQWHALDGVGLAPLLPKAPIPIWIGCGDGARSLSRVGRLGDGWIPWSMIPRDRVGQAWDVIRRSAEQAGRDPDAVGLEGFVALRGGWPEVEESIAWWSTLGATHLTLNTLGCGIGSPSEHAAAFDRFATLVRS